jgi:flagellar biosynthesis/type III secretory pathway M-ring protein FliF/YscJ
MNYISPMANNVAWHHAVETLLGIDLTPRCKVIRTIVAELAREADPSHRARIFLDFIDGLEAAMPEIADKIDPEKVEGEMIKEKVISLVEGNPHKAALILRDWLHADLAKKKDDKAPAAGGKGK